MDFLSNKFQAISVRREYLLSERKFGQFYGEMMSGKSMAMAAMLHYYNMHGRTGVIGLQNSGDVIQFEGSIITYNKMYAKYYERKDWNTIPLEWGFFTFIFS
jgi:Tfp pilus assembly ATPase PilU